MFRLVLVAHRTLSRGNHRARTLRRRASCGCGSHLHAPPHDLQGVDDGLRQHAGNGPVQQDVGCANLVLLQALQLCLIAQCMHSRAARR